MNLSQRPRRNRKSAIIRNLVSEFTLSPEKLIQPIFLTEGDRLEAIESLPGQHRWPLKQLQEEASILHQLGIGGILLFPNIDGSLKTSCSKEAYNPDGLVPRAIQAIKEQCPEMVVMTDVALDPYNIDGHDGLVDSEGRIMNDETVAVLCQQSLCHAQAGADVVAPSDMMDGRVAAIRKALDEASHTEVSIMSYTAKYASSFYGPFRGALDSAPRHGDKKTYQMDPRNASEALREAQLDASEGADILMVKPASHYLDVLHTLKKNIPLPFCAYQVSGEYLMIKAASKAGWLSEQETVLESLTCIHRAGADMIATYFAKEAASTFN